MQSSFSIAVVSQSSYELIKVASILYKSSIAFSIILAFDSRFCNTLPSSAVIASTRALNFDWISFERAWVFTFRIETISDFVVLF